MTPVLTPKHQSTLSSWDSHEHGTHRGGKRLRRSARLRDLPPTIHTTTALPQQGQATIISVSTGGGTHNSRITPAPAVAFSNRTTLTTTQPSISSSAGPMRLPNRRRRHSSRLFATNPYANWRLDAKYLTAAPSPRSLGPVWTNPNGMELDAEEDEDDEDYDEEDSHLELIPLDHVSRALVTHALPTHPSSSVLVPEHAAESFSLSHDYKSTYGTDYYTSLLEREQKQLDQSHVRLHGSSASSSSLGRSTSHHSLDSSSVRMRTRSHRTRLGSEVLEVDPEEETEEEKEEEEEEDSSASPDRILNKVQLKITPRMRSTLVGWIMDVATETKLRHETLHYCIQLLDRILEEIPLTKNNFQCYGCSCLLIAGKLGEKNSPRAADIAFLTDSICNMRDITEAELNIVTTLEFNLQLVSAYNFVDRFLTASYISDGCWSKSTLGSSTLTKDMNGTEDAASWSSNASFHLDSFAMNPKLEATCLFYLDMSLFDSRLVGKPRSLIAAAALYLARVTVGVRECTGDIWNDALVAYTGYEVSEIDDVIIRLHNIHVNVLETKNEQNRAVLKKYSDAKYLRVSRNPPILRQAIFLPTKKKQSS